MTLAIKAYSNCDHAFVVWRTTAKISNCLGFALVRRGANGQQETLKTWVGFASDPDAVPGTHKDSTEWPIQKFMWSDYFAKTGTTYSYQVTPMIGNSGQLVQGTPGPWSNPIRVGNSDGVISSYFNRGIVATQWLARRLGGASPKDKRKKLASVIGDIKDRTRQFLAGELRTEMLELLDRATHSDDRVYGALYELNDPELISELTKLGKRANVVLSNGTHKAKGKETEVDENATARGQLRNKVNLFDRMVSDNHLAHNKFLVFCDSADNPKAIWTGSTNWTETGLCTQANNGILINDSKAASVFKEEWNLLVQAGSGYPKTLVASNTEKKTFSIGSRNVAIWFAPVQGLVDLNYARRLIMGAQEGVLFLFFNPGPKGTLLNDILSLDASRLYIHGVVNQDPGGKKQPVLLVHRGQKIYASADVTLPEAVDQRLKYWQPELKNYSLVMVHSKVVLVDPFGKHPVVITGSHNLGPKASSKNDDNMVVIENDSQLASEYAVNIMGIYNQYRWRYMRLQMKNPNRWDGLIGDDSWQDRYFAGPAAKEIDFWFGKTD